MQDYTRHTLEMLERLRGIGEEIKDFHAATLLLSVLPESYEMLFAALNSCPDDELTLEHVKGKLVDEYKCKTESINSDGSSVAKSALKMKIGIKTETCNKKHENVLCARNTII